MCTILVFELIKHHYIRIQVCMCASFRTVHYTLLPKVFTYPLNSGVLITSVPTGVHNQAPNASTNISVIMDRS